MPCLRLLFFVAPGLWRNICPLAAANQTPRLLGLRRGLAAPAWLKERGYVLAIAMFLVIVAARKLVFDTNGTALALLLVAVILAAFAGGVVLKGKSGWCSTLCPVLPRPAADLLLAQHPRPAGRRGRAEGGAGHR